jgi:hypothetical protein
VLYPALGRLGSARNRSAVGFHTFRHSAATIVNQRTGNLKLVQKLLGHSDLRTTADVHTHASADAESKCCARIRAGDRRRFVPNCFTFWEEEQLRSDERRLVAKEILATQTMREV